MRRWAILIIPILAVGGLHPRGYAGPEPSIVPVSWELDFEYLDPQRITIKLPGEKEAKTYWYMIYTVTNNTGKDLDFIPGFELVTQTLQKLDNNIGVPTGVFDAVKRRHARLYPLLVGPVEVYGLLLQGDDNAWDSLAIWPQFDLKANKFSIYVNGLSGERLRIVNPAWQLQKQGKKLPNVNEVPQFFNLQKTLKIDYDLPGDPQTRHLVNPVRIGQSWVMR